MSPAMSHLIFFGALALVAAAATAFEVRSERRRRNDMFDGFMDWNAVFPLDDEGEAA